MAGPALEYAYRYAAPSALEPGRGGPRLRLSTSGGAEAHPFFFEGRLAAPRPAADLLLSCAQVARARYHVPPAMLARILQAADPVVTSGIDRLRFEAFSACGSVYARLDLLPGAVEGERHGLGTTNVDFGPAMRAALTRVGAGETVRLAVGTGAVALAADGGTVVERRVALPLRWLKGFLEVQAIQARMSLRLAVGAAEAHRVLRELPRGAVRGTVWAAPAGRGIRLSHVPSGQGVRVGGPERLRLLEPLARHARGLRVYASEEGEASVWELALEGARFVLALSADVWRGFSGEGQALSGLAAGPSESVVTRVRAALTWQPRLEPGALAAETGLDATQIDSALARLGARGLVGYDLADAAYFHRELPFDLDLVESLQPRLREARRLVAERGVELPGDCSAEAIEAWVRGSGVEHRVHVAEGGSRCSCPWWSRHGGSRGPCKHVLAVQLALEEIP